MSKSQRPQTAAEASPYRPATGRARILKYAAINAFIIFHLVAIACWAIPIHIRVTSAVKEFVRPYFVWSGLFQTWDMFSPQPKSGNVYLEAVILYRDGTSELWTFPRMEQLNFRERYFKERYRKYEEILNSDDYFALRPDAARYLARMKSTPANPVQSVILVARSSEIIPRNDESYDRGPWNVRVLYTLDVRREDLR
jgi:hypothetical protein